MVVEAPGTQYAETADGVHVAYQVVGAGPVDLVFLMPGILPIEVVWEDDSAGRFFTRLGSFSRLLLFDARGGGASDVGSLFTFETYMDDVSAVLDAADAQRVVLVGFGEVGPIATMFAATYPDRTLSLVLINSCARWARDVDYPWGAPPQWAARVIDQLFARWGTGVTGDASPSMAGIESFRRWAGRCERVCGGPRASVDALRHSFSRDVRPVLSSVRVPTLVLHRSGDQLLPVGHGRYLAEHILGAKYVEFVGADHHFFVGDQDAILDEIEEFITGAPPTRQPDRMLSTVLFTDIVDSTDRAARAGDKDWLRLLDRHDAIVAHELDRHRGRKFNPTGDGVLATFDGLARAIRCACAIRDPRRRQATRA